MSEERLIVVYPARDFGADGWVSREAEQVRPFFHKLDHARGYAMSRRTSRRGVEVRAADGTVLETFPPLIEADAGYQASGSMRGAFPEYAP